MFSSNSYLRTLQTTGEVTEFYYWACERNTLDTLDGYFITIYTISLHVIALFLIFRTRKIKLSALNDYKANSAIVYVETGVILALGVSLSLVLHRPNLFALLGSTLIFFGDTAFLALTFIPKVGKAE